jgi:hypothetical protein
MNSIIKLTNGETIIAEVVNEDDQYISVLEPLALEIAESETGKPMMVALTWVPLTKKINMVNLKTPHVVAISECDEEISKYYEKSLAVLKGDVKKLREILLEEATDEDLDEIRERVLDDEGEHDPWMKKFGTPIEIELSANTVH